MGLCRSQARSHQLSIEIERRYAADVDDPHPGQWAHTGLWRFQYGACTTINTPGHHDAQWPCVLISLPFAASVRLIVIDSGLTVRTIADFSAPSIERGPVVGHWIKWIVSWCGRLLRGLECRIAQVGAYGNNRRFHIPITLKANKESERGRGWILGYAYLLLAFAVLHLRTFSRM